MQLLWFYDASTQLKTLHSIVIKFAFILSVNRYVCETESGVMCLDFHPEHPNYIAAGFYDGKLKD